MLSQRAIPSALNHCRTPLLPISGNFRRAPEFPVAEPSANTGLYRQFYAISQLTLHDRHSGAPQHQTNLIPFSDTPPRLGTVPNRSGVTEQSRLFLTHVPAVATTGQRANTNRPSGPSFYKTNLVPFSDTPRNRRMPRGTNYLRPMRRAHLLYTIWY